MFLKWGKWVAGRGIPEAPSIVNVHGADDDEDSPFHQSVLLELEPASVVAGIRNFRVRIVWYESVESGNKVSWNRLEDLFETRNARTNITVRDLIAGRSYQFQARALPSVM